MDPNNLHRVTTHRYDSAPLQEDGRLVAHRIEFEVTLRTILGLLSPAKPSTVLDIGGATGRYAFALAENGHDVTLVDVSPGLLGIARARAAANPTSPAPTHILECDALHIDALDLDREVFDAVLLLGPLYHIMSSTLRDDAFRKAWARVAPGGVLVCAWVSRWAHYRDVAVRDPVRLVKRREFYVQHALDGDYVQRDDLGNLSHAMNHEHPANMPGILRRITGQESVRMVGAEGVLSGGLDRLVNELQGDAFEAWVQKCIEAGNDEFGWMMSDHILGIARKPPLEVAHTQY